MTEFFVTLLTNTYALMGLLGLIAYVPTILDLWRNKSGINPFSYGMWWLTSAVAALYLGFVVGNVTMLGVYSLHVVACSLVLSFNWRYQRKVAYFRDSLLKPDLTTNKKSLG